MAKANIQAFFMDALQIFAANATVLTASGVIGAYIDLKGLGYAPAVVVVDVSVIDTANADETYDLVVELGIDNANYVEFCSRPALIVGRMHIPVSNQVGAVMYNSMRLSLVAAGTTPSITLGAFLTDAVPAANS